MTLFSGVCSASWAVTRFRFILINTSRDLGVRRGGASGITMAFREDSSLAKSVRAQLRDAGGAQKRGASNQRRIGMWSEPVEGRGSDHLVKYGARKGQAKSKVEDARVPNK